MSETSGLISPCGFRLQAIDTRCSPSYWILGWYYFPKSNQSHQYSVWIGFPFAPEYINPDLPPHLSSRERHHPSALGDPAGALEGGQGRNSAETHKNARDLTSLINAVSHWVSLDQRGREQESSLRDDYTAAGNIGGVFDGAREGVCTPSRWFRLATAPVSTPPLALRVNSGKEYASFLRLGLVCIAFPP